MHDVTASTGDGYVGVNNTSKTASRDATSAVFGNTTTTSMIAIHAFFFSRYYIYRPIILFDLSGNDDSGDSLSGNTVSSATLQVTTLANLSGFVSYVASTDNKLVVAKTDGVGSSINTADWNALDGWPSSGTYEGNVTKYGEITQAADSTLDISLSAQAVTDINSAISAGSDSFSMMILTEDDWTYDADLCASSTFEGVRIYSANNSSSKPKLVLTYSAAPSGYSNKVSGVTSGNISAVTNVATANISKVNGV